MKQDSLKALHLIVKTLFEKKAFNILILDVRGLSTLTDYFVIAEGTVDRHVSALAKAVLETMKDEIPAHVEGIEEGQWVVVDYFEVVVHLFIPWMRDRYRLEELWHEGKIVDLAVSTPAIA